MVNPERRTLSRRSMLLLASLSATELARRLASPSQAQAATVFPGSSWATATPASQGVDPTLLNQAMSYLASVTGSDKTTQALVVRNGYLIWKGSAIDTAHNVWSITKSITSTTLGLLVDDGKVTVGTLARTHVSSLAERYPKVTLRHFVTMTSGYDAKGGDQSTTPFVPAAPLFVPGTHYLYWDAAMNQCANVLTRAAKEPLKGLFKRRIADPIGMQATRWNWGDWGTIDGWVVHGGAGNKGKGFTTSASNLARIGLLFLNRGTWNGRRVLSSAWVDAATSVQVPASTPLFSKDKGPGIYGFNWWVNGVRPDGTRPWPAAPASTYKASGHNDNRLWVIPPWNMVIVRLGTSGNQLDFTKENNFLKKVKQALIT